jgi:hypothetical protein
MNLSLVIGTPAMITFMASSYSTLMENFVFFALLSVAAMVVAILPRIHGKPAHR